jgi:Acyl-CoA carboxylase epsilon subunit
MTEEPLLRVERGEPTDEELAALFAAVSATVEARRVEPEHRPTTWSAYWRSVGTLPPPGPSTWRNSALPR